MTIKQIIAKVLEFLQVKDPVEVDTDYFDVTINPDGSYTVDVNYGGVVGSVLAQGTAPTQTVAEIRVDTVLAQERARQAEQRALDAATIRYREAV